MKTKIYFLLLLTTPLFLINCGSDDGDADYISQFVGTWQSSSVVSTGCTNSEDNGTLTCTPFCYQAVFTAQGTYSLIDGTSGQGINESGTFKATGTTLTLCEDGTCDDDPATYEFTNDNTVVVTFTDDDSPGCQFAATFNKQ